MRERTREELKPTRRKAYERRYLMLSALRPQLLAAADALAPHAATRPAPAEFVYSERVIKIPVAPAPTPLLPAVLNHSF